MLKRSTIQRTIAVARRKLACGLAVIPAICLAVIFLPLPVMAIPVDELPGNLPGTTAGEITLHVSPAQADALAIIATMTPEDAPPGADAQEHAAWLANHEPDFRAIAGMTNLPSDEGSSAGLAKKVAAMDRGDTNAADKSESDDNNLADIVGVAALAVLAVGVIIRYSARRSRRRRSGAKPSAAPVASASSGRRRERVRIRKPI